jgi:hypothetical protein
MMPFLRRFIKRETILQVSKSVDQLVTFDLEDRDAQTDLLTLNIGFAAKAALDEVIASKKVNERVKIEFLTDCRIFLQAMTKKLLEKSSLRFKLVYGNYDSSRRH